jgi:hypothetical protein
MGCSLAVTKRSPVSTKTRERLTTILIVEKKREGKLEVGKEQRSGNAESMKESKHRIIVAF